MKKMKKVLALSLGLAALTLSMTQSAQAVTVNSTYINKTGTEIRGIFGGYTNPTIYINRYACGEQQLSAFACGTNTISVGTSFLQGAETNYGNYSAKAILGHEWGHTIQFSRSTRPAAPYLELQADCIGGSFINYAVNTLRYANFLTSAVNTARAYAGGDHGTPAQRDYYTRWGYTNGHVKCLNSMPRV
jgi:predicted metalloprotease